MRTPARSSGSPRSRPSVACSSGTDSAVINGAVSSIQSHFDVGPGPLGFAVAAALLGAAVGAFFGSRIADRTGRILIMKIAAVLFLASAIGCGLANDITTLVIFRVIGGVGVGSWPPRSAAAWPMTSPSWSSSA